MINRSIKCDLFFSVPFVQYRMFKPLKIMETNFEQTRVFLSFLTYNWESLIQIPSVHAHKITFSLPNHCKTEGSNLCEGVLKMG